MCLPLLFGLAGAAQAYEGIVITAPPDASEGHAGTTDRTFRVRLTGPVSGDVNFSVCFSGTATREDDYEVLLGSAVQSADCVNGRIPRGWTTPDSAIGIRVAGDMVSESRRWRGEYGETVTAQLTLVGAQPWDLDGRRAHTVTHTILNDDVAVRFRAADVEGREGKRVRVQVDLVESTQGYPWAVTVPFTYTRGTASNSDFDASRTSLTFWRGQTTQDLYVDLPDDSNFESDETFTIGFDTASFPAGMYVAGLARTGVTIKDNDYSISTNSVSYSAREDAGGVSIQVTISPAQERTVGVRVSFQELLHADRGVDYLAEHHSFPDGVLTFHPGETIKSFFIPLINDGIFQNNGILKVTLTQTVGPTDPITRDVIIADHRPADGEYTSKLTLSRTSQETAYEGGQSATFRLKMHPPVQRSSTVAVALSQSADDGGRGNWIAGAPDTRAHYVTVDFAQWESVKTLTVPIRSDGRDTNGTLTVAAMAPGAHPKSAGTYTARGQKVTAKVRIRDTIADGDPFRSASAQQAVVTQVPSTAVTNLQVTAVDGNTAKATWDAVPHATGYLVEFESTSALTDPANYVYGSAGGVTGTARSYTHNAAEAMTLTVTVTPELREDGNVKRFDALAGTATIGVGPAGTQSALGQDSVGTATCDTASLKSDIAGYIGEQADGTPHVTRWKRVLAAFGDDNGYTAMTAAEAQTWADRGWSRWDPVVEALECLENAGGVNPEPQPDPDPAPGITVTGGGGVTEGGDAVFTVHSNPAPSSDLAVTVNVDDDQTSDFLAEGNEGTRTVTVLAGRTSATLTLATENDGTDEPDGSVSVTALDGTGYTVGNPGTAAVPVADDDDPPAVTPVVGIAGSSGITEGGSVSYTLTANPAPQGDIAVTVTIADSGSFALSGQTGTRTVTVGASGTATFTVATDNDAVDEADGGITATIQSGTGYTVASSPDDTASVAVSDDDDPVIGIAGGAGVTEGTPASFTLTANPAPHADLTVTLKIAQSGDYTASGQTGTRNITVPTGGSVTFGVATVNDTADEPDGSVTATLAAGTGYVVAVSPDDTATVAVSDDDAAAAVPEGPSLSVNDVEVKEGPYRRVEFTVTLSEASDRYVSFHYRVRESDPVSARRNADFWGPVSKQFAGMRPGQTEYRIPAGMVIDDSHDEDPETFEIVLSDANGAAIADGVGVATIVNNDPMPAAFLSRFGRTVAQQALEGISDRMAIERTSGVTGTVAGHIDLGSFSSSGADSFGNVNNLPAENNPVIGNGHGWGLKETGWGFENSDGWGLKDVSGWSTREMTLREAVMGSSFTATGREDAMGGSLSFWGRGSESSFDGREGAFSLDGDASTAMLGADYARDGWLLGLALLQSDGEGGYADSGTGPQGCPGGMEGMEGMGEIPCDGAVRMGDGKVESTLTAAVPYGSLRMSERIGLWGAIGHGTGEVSLRPDTMTTGDALESDITWTMASMGMRGDLLQLQENGPALALTADALWARTESDRTVELAGSESAVTRLRLGLEGSWRLALGGGGHLTPKLELGLRHDGGDAETGSGIELGASVSWSSPAAGIRLDLSGRTLVSHDDDDLEDRGFSADLSFDPDGNTKRGLSFSLRQELGDQSQGGLDALFAAGPLSDRAGGGNEESRWTLEGAWGFPALGGRYTGSPHAGMGISGDTRDWSVGWRLAPESGSAADLSFGVRATRRESIDAVPENIFGFEASLRW